jgi:hypothetical protein
MVYTTVGVPAVELDNVVSATFESSSVDHTALRFLSQLALLCTYRWHSLNELWNMDQRAS